MSVIPVIVAVMSVTQEIILVVRLQPTVVVDHGCRKVVFNSMGLVLGADVGNSNSIYGHVR